MSIQYPRPPADTERLAATGISILMRHPQIMTSSGAPFAMLTPDEVTLSAPHPVFNLEIPDCLERRPFAQSRHVGWRYLVRANSESIATSEVAVGQDGEPSEFAQLNGGPFVRSTERIFDEVSGIPEVSEGTYEVRMLRMPALYVMALWLRGIEGHDDLVMPLEPAPSFLNPRHTYHEGEFLDALAGPARERLRVASSS